MLCLPRPVCAVRQSETKFNNQITGSLCPEISFAFLLVGQLHGKLLWYSVEQKVICHGVHFLLGQYVVFNLQLRYLLTKRLETLKSSTIFSKVCLRSTSTASISPLFLNDASYSWRHRFHETFGIRCKNASLNQLVSISLRQRRLFLGIIGEGNTWQTRCKYVYTWRTHVVDQKAKTRGKHAANTCTRGKQVVNTQQIRVHVANTRQTHGKHMYTWQTRVLNQEWQSYHYLHIHIYT